MRLVVGVSAVLAVGIAAQVPSQASASTPDAAGLVAIARSYLEARAAALVMGSGTSQARASLAAVPMAAPLQTETSQAITVLAARRQADHAGGVDYIRAVVTLLHPAISTESDGTTTLHVTDDTRLYFKPIRGAPPHEEWSVGRTFTFKQGASVPVLVGARLTDSSGPVTTVDVAPGETAGGAANSSTPAPSSAATVAPGAASTVRSAHPSRLARTSATKAQGGVVSAISYYNYSAMISFETKYWNTTLTPRWNNDCTNFLSRALLAGGWAQVSKLPYGADRNYSNVWYDSYLPGPGGHWWYSYSWSISNNWNTFARGSGRVTALTNIWYADRT
jgi:hypothetical protein